MKNKNVLIHISDDVESLLSEIADFFVNQCKEAVSKNGKFSVALSGGASPAKLYTLLASEKYRRQLPWEKILFFFGDERFVPASHPESNYRMAKETLFDPLRISANQIIAVDTSVSPSGAALQYEQMIRKYFHHNFAFDMILLGLGENAHTASLFPHTDVLNVKDILVKEVFVKELNQFRITFTAPLINHAKVIAFLVYGPAKANAVYHILRDPYKPEEYPAQLVKPVSGVVHWFVDKQAAAHYTDLPAG